MLAIVLVNIIVIFLNAKNFLNSEVVLKWRLNTIASRWDQAYLRGDASQFLLILDEKIGRILSFSLPTAVRI